MKIHANIKKKNYIKNNFDDLNFNLNFDDYNVDNLNFDYYKIKSNYNNISFITLTNNGYIDYTLNCIESLKKIKSPISLKCYCVGKTCFDTLKSKNIETYLINDDTKNLSDFVIFKNKNWNKITFLKLKIIYENLLNNDFVIFTDGDIVFENDDLFSYLIKNINDNDLLIQNEYSLNEYCSGFMFIKSNDKTLNLFNPKNISELYNNWDDQYYINNNIKSKNIKAVKLPDTLFPNGNFYYKFNKNLNPYLIHFNFLIGNQKKEHMKIFNKWYI